MQTAGKGYLVFGGIAAACVLLFVLGGIAGGAMGAFSCAAGISLAAGALGMLCAGSIRKSWGFVPAVITAGMIRVVFAGSGVVLYLLMQPRNVFVFLLSLVTLYFAVLIIETVFVVRDARRIDFEREGGV